MAQHTAATPTATVDDAVTPVRSSAPRRHTAAERRMRRLLRVSTVDKKASPAAHRAFRISLVISGIRCLLTYLLVPLLVPIVSFAGVLAAPLGIAMCLLAYASGIAGVRRFWIADHRSKWTYTWFIAVVFVVVTVALVADITRLFS